jgi:hypothetical protein
VDLAPTWSINDADGHRFAWTARLHCLEQPPRNTGHTPSLNLLLTTSLSPCGYVFEG